LGWSLGEAMRTPHFWLLFLVYLFTGLGSFLVSLHQLAFAISIGFDKIYAAEVLGIGAFLAVPGIIVTGTLSDYLGREVSETLAPGPVRSLRARGCRALRPSAVPPLGGASPLLTAGPEQLLLLGRPACFFGLPGGARGRATPAKTADLFPGPRLGTILGVIT